jgi:hypothetical protein
LAALALAAPTTRDAWASARSSNGAMVVSPLTGSAGTHLTLDTHIFSDTIGTYEMRFTTTAPAQGGCTSSKPLPVAGVNPFQAGGVAPTTLAFDWPTSLGSNQYYFCVYPAAASATPGATPSPTTPANFQTGETARSLQPFTVLRDASPAIVFTPPPGGVPLGSTVAVQVNDWRSSDHQPPARIWLVTADGYTWYDVPFRALSAPDASGTTTLKLTLPASFPGVPFDSPATYFLVAGGPGIYQASAPFQVDPLSVATATVGGTPLASPTTSVPPQRTSPGQAASSALIVALSGLTLLIALGLVAVVIVLALRGRADARRDAMGRLGLDIEPLESVPARSAARPDGRLPDAGWGTGGLDAGRQRGQLRDDARGGDGDAWGHGWADEWSSGGRRRPPTRPQ